MNYLDTFINGYTGYWNYLKGELTFSNEPWWHNYLLMLLIVSAFFFVLELVKPWRTNQAKFFRKDFWLDFFYMFFNFFLFSLIIYNAASDVVVNVFNSWLAFFGITNLLAINVQAMPLWAHLVIGFLVRDFVQWWIHRLLHRVPFLWNFHKVHHSVEQMGFAAHLRYHWMENVVYRSIEYLPLALIGIGLNDFFIIHIFTLAIGHYNHSNITVAPRISGGVFGLVLGLFMAVLVFDFGLGANIGLVAGSMAFGYIIVGPYMKIIFNNPEMHIWHHSHDLPKDKPYGINFGLSLAIWDYIFKTAVIPHNGRDIKLGFPKLETFPKSFWTQQVFGFFRRSH